MRSSIACARCRRSKIKCVNAGVDTTCRACEASGRDCVYPAPATGGAAKRDLATLADGDDRNGDWDSPKRQRSRKTTGSKDPSRAMLDVLDSSILTPKVWEAVFDLFQSHFATLLPFLHPATFLSHIRLLSSPAPAQESPGRPQGLKTDPLIPLGVLALTARFHPQLVAYHSPPSHGSPSNPTVASEFYATALRSRLAGMDSVSLAVPDLTRVQTLLMLALHEWGLCRGKSAWLYVGMAIRLAQAMGLPFELENDLLSREGPPASLKADVDHYSMTHRAEAREQTSDDVIAQETKRRTFWACFVLDRCLSSGKYRPRMIRVKDLDIQLPSDNAFAFGERVRTAQLYEPLSRRTQNNNGSVQIPSIRQGFALGDEKLVTNGTSERRSWSPTSRRKDSSESEIDRWEIGAEEPVLSRVIRIIRGWGSIAKWSCAGRGNEQFAPWHTDSRFCKLRMMLGDFEGGLSRNLQYSPRNTETHLMYKNTLAPYAMMHVVYFLSVIVLHRSYIPFLPLRCSEPAGPLDEPAFSMDKTTMPEGFWRESARDLFRAARQMIDLVVACQERGALVENPLAGFAIYNAAFIGIYAMHFPHMDREGYLCTKPGNDSQGHVCVRKALEVLREMRPRLKMAAGWFRTLNRLHSYYTKVKRDFRGLSRKVEVDYVGKLSGMRVRENGGELEEIKLVERLFHDFGNLVDQLPEVPEEELAIAISEHGSNTVKSEIEAGETMDGPGIRRESWVPVNNSSGMPERRPSLPLPPARGLQPQAGYSLPSFPHHTDGPLFNTPANLPSLSAPVSYTSPTQSSGQYGTAAPNRLQPLSSWITRPPPPYSQSLPPINATAAHGLLLPPPGGVSQSMASPPASLDAAEQAVWMTSLGGDDVVAFLEGCEPERLGGMGSSEVGVRGGWLSTIWGEWR